VLFTGTNLLLFSELPSTNSTAWELLPQRPAEGTVIQALHQTEGRGQGGTVWQAAPGENLTLSVIYYPAFVPSRDAFSVSKMAALAVLRTVRGLVSATDEVLIKWPNDILLNRRKVAGILIENQLEGNTLKACIIGIGLNVSQLAFSEEVQHKATSLALTTGKALNPDAVRDALLGNLEAAYLHLRRGGRDHLASDYLCALWGYHEEVSLLLDGVEQRRTIMGVDPSGRLAISGETPGTLRMLDLKEATFWV
jgi:BirA family biotin operon repressor/biotin-[acetyl-CoA-carboxylase] ligase